MRINLGIAERAVLDIIKLICSLQGKKLFNRVELNLYKYNYKSNNTLGYYLRLKFLIL